jgi:GH18 family chitinase
MINTSHILILFILNQVIEDNEASTEAIESTSNALTSTTTQRTSAQIYEQSVANKRIVCYYTNWSQYRNAKARFVPQDIDPFLCTHIIYAFAKINSNGILEPYEWNDLSTPWSIGMYERMMNLKNKNPDLKIILAVGGYFLRFFFQNKYFFLFK